MRNIIYFILLVSSIAQAEIKNETQLELCPIPKLSPEEINIDTVTRKGHDEPYVDPSKPIKDIGTDIVVKEFFSTQQSLYNFMALVYTGLERALNKYKNDNNLDDRAISLVFKGGNVLRIVANGVFSQLPQKARELLKDNYDKDFKRSDADFSVYIDENKIKDLNYDKVFAAINELVYDELNKIRAEFIAHPTKYFEFLKLKPKEAAKELENYFAELKKSPIFADKSNKWFGAQMLQLQLLDDRVSDASKCRYFGQLDYKFEEIDGKISGTPLTKKPSWIVNTDNRTPEWPLGSNPKNRTKFSLVRSKVAFEYTFKKDGNIVRKPIGGELIDVSIPHRLDHSIRNFLDHYDQNIAEYTVLSPKGTDKLIMKSYSLDYLAEDLQGILFDSFDRPWKGGPKYAKRINRLLFLFLAQLLGSFGSGQEAENYIADAQNNIINLSKELYPLTKNSTTLAEQIKENALKLSKSYPQMTVANNFWYALADLILSRLIPSPEDEDAESFKALLLAIEENLKIALKVSEMPDIKIIPNKVYQTDMDKLF